MIYTLTLRKGVAFSHYHWIVLGSACALFAGCASVNPEPFVKYRNSVQEAHTGIDAAMSVNYDWTRSGFIDGFSSDADSRFTQLIIQPGAGYEWELPLSPIYLSVKQTRSGLAKLNESFVKYADLLATLAGDDLVSITTFDQLAKNLNENITDAAEALGLDAPPKGIALFSTAASEAARLYIENRRQKHLKRMIELNQANVADYSALCISLIHTIRGNIKSYYVERIEPIRIAWNSTTGAARHRNTEAMLNINEQFADAMRVLQELETVYRTLPNAHADLANAIEKPDLDFAGIQKLYGSAKRLQHLYSELNKTANKEINAENP